MPEKPVVFCLMGPTASGKTRLAVELVDRYPLDIISVDSALVYRGMDIGTAKPDAALLAVAPHRLIDIRNPEDGYSAGEFARDADREIRAILGQGRTPLLAGGTMLYFRALIDGIAGLPAADPAIRAELDREAAEEGWPALHAKLAAVDAQAAARIDVNDRQRIQRALEVYRISNRSISDWQSETARDPGYEFVRIALIDADRAKLHRRINRRFREMLDAGFLNEVRRLRSRPGLVADSPAMRSVGYRQLWAHLDGACDLDTAIARGQAATRQLAKRQLTWLRSAPRLKEFDPLEPGTPASISILVGSKLNK